MNQSISLSFSQFTLNNTHVSTALIYMRPSQERPIQTSVSLNTHNPGIFRPIKTFPTVMHLKDSDRHFKEDPSRDELVIRDIGL